VIEIKKIQTKITEKVFNFFNLMDQIVP